MPNDITIKLRVDDQGSVVIDKFASQGSRKLRDFTGSTTSSIGAMTSTMKSYWVEITAAVAAFKSTWNMIELGATLKKHEEAFKNLAASYGVSARMIISEIERVSKATIDQSEIMQIGGAAMLRGLDPGKFIKLMEVARQAARINGKSIVETWEGITKAVSTGRPRGMGEYGIPIKEADAMNRYEKETGKATDAMGMADRQHAIFNETMRQGAIIQERLGAAATSSSLMFAQWSAVMVEIKDKTAGGLLRAFQLVLSACGAVSVAFYGLIASIFAGLADLSRDVDSVIDKLPQWAKDKVGITEGISGVTTMLESYKQAFTGMAESAITFTGTNWELATSFDETEAKVGKLPPAYDDLGDSAEKAVKAQEKMNDILKDADKAVDAANFSEYAKKLYDINQKYGEQAEKLKELATAKNGERISTEQYVAALEKLRKGYVAETIQAQTDALKEQQKVLDDVSDKMQEATATVNMTDLEKKIYDVNVAWNEQGKKIDEVFEKTEGLEGNAERYKQAMEKIEAGRIAEIQRTKNEELEKNSKETYENMAEFFRDALVQMDGDAGSFIDSLIAKFKNLAASIAANVLSSLAMQAGGGLASMLGMGGMFGMGGGGAGGAGGGFNIMSLLSGGKTAYGAFNNGTLSPFFGGGQLGMNTALPASLGGGPLPLGAESMSWLGAGAGALGVLGGGYGVYNAYKSGSPGMGALSGAGMGLGGVTLAASGALGSTLAGAAAGSVVPIVGTIVGAAVGAAIAAFGLSAAGEAKEEQRLAANYYRGVGRAANADISKMSLNEYIAGGSSVLGPGATEAAIKVGGLGGTKNIDQLYNLVDVAKDYKKAVEEMGGASAQALGQFSRVQSTMDVFAIKSGLWTGDARALAQQWLQVGKNIKELQIKELTGNLTQGIGLFSANIDKLRMVGMDTKAFNELVASEGLKFLTTDTLPALAGELSKVREEYKKAAEEVKEYAEQEAAVGVKQQILASDMALTEAQLQTLKYGEVNTDLIALYTALGWVDKEMGLVTAASQDMVDVWTALSEAGKTLQANIDGMAAAYKNVDIDKIPDALLKTYGMLTQIAATLDLVGVAGEKMSGLPDVLEAMNSALQAGDMAALNTELLKLTDTLMYMSGAAGALGWGQIATGLSGAGGIIGQLYAAIELTLLFQRTWQDVVRKMATSNTDVYDWMVKNLEMIAAKYPKFAAKWLGIISGGADVTGSLGQFGGMTYEGAIAVAGQYNTTSQAEIGNRAIGVLQEQIIKLREGGTTKAEFAEIEAINAAIKQIQEGLSVAADNFTKSLKIIIGTAGMSDFEKQLFNLNEWYGQQKETLDSLGLSTEEYNNALSLLNQAFSVQGLEAVNGYFDAIKKSISDYRNSILTSQYNVFANPDQMGQNFAAQYQQSLSAFNSADAGNMGTAWSTLQKDSQAYLDYMFQQYGSSATYQAAYSQVMAMLQSAEVRAASAQSVYASKYEIDNIAQMTAIAGNTQATIDQIIALRAEVRALHTAIGTLTTTVAATPVQTGKAVALYSTGKKK